MNQSEKVIIGKAIEYLEEERNSIRDSYTKPSTGKVEDREGLEWIEELNILINDLSKGTAGGQAFIQARNSKEVTVNPKLIAEAWDIFCEQYKCTGAIR